MSYILEYLEITAKETGQYHVPPCHPGLTLRPNTLHSHTFFFPAYLSAGMNYRHGFPASFWATCIFSKERCPPPWRTKVPPEPWGLRSFGSFPSLQDLTWILLRNAPAWNRSGGQGCSTTPRALLLRTTKGTHGHSPGHFGSVPSTPGLKCSLCELGGFSWPHGFKAGSRLHEVTAT